MTPDTSKLEKNIGVSFADKKILLESLTHRSYLNEHPKWGVPHNERLEYLGDAVLELAVSEELFKMFPDYPEGQMTLLRAALVNYQMMSRIAKEIGLDDFILMSKGEKGDSSRAKEVILANAIEAVIGAIYLGQGFDVTKKFVKNFVINHLKEVLATKSYKDAKSELQEIIQEKLKITPVYKVLSESGPAHEREFEIGVYFGEKLIASGKGASKQEAELEAAKNALEKYK